MRFNLEKRSACLSGDYCEADKPETKRKRKKRSKLVVHLNVTPDTLGLFDAMLSCRPHQAESSAAPVDRAKGSGSQNAYMLIYRKRGTFLEDSEGALPQHLRRTQQRVNAKNVKFLQEVKVEVCQCDAL